MRLTLALALITAACAPAPAPSAPPTPAAAQTAPSADVAACVTAAQTRDAMRQCKGVSAQACMLEEGGESTMGMVMCFSDESQAWDAQLQSALTRMRAVDDGRGAYFERANETWAAWLEAECAYQASENEGGSLARVTAASCTADLTADRAIALLSHERTLQ